LQNRIEPFPQKIRLTAYNMVKLMIIIVQDRRSYIQGVREGSTRVSEKVQLIKCTTQQVHKYC